MIYESEDPMSDFPETVPTTDVPMTPPEKKSNKTMIIIIVVLVLLCCCCVCLSAFGFYAYQNGDSWMQDAGVYSILPLLSIGG
jgi:hypothetical protein